MTDRPRARTRPDTGSAAAIRAELAELADYAGQHPDFLPEDVVLLPPHRGRACDGPAGDVSPELSALRTYAEEHEKARRHSHCRPIPVETFPGVALAGEFRPWGVFLEIGGDWFDAVPLDGGGDAPVDSAGLIVRRGILLNVLNPKLTLSFFAFLPQFLDASPGLLDAGLIWLGGVFMLMTLAVFAVYALASAAARDLVLAASAARRWVERTLGAFLIAFAVRLALADR